MAIVPYGGGPTAFTRQEQALVLTMTPVLARGRHIPSWYLGSPILYTLVRGALWGAALVGASYAVGYASERGRRLAGGQ